MSVPCVHVQAALCLLPLVPVESACCFGCLHSAFVLQSLEEFVGQRGLTQRGKGTLRELIEVGKTVTVCKFQT